MGVTGVYAGHFSVSQFCDGVAYLLSVAVNLSRPQRRAAINYGLIGQLLFRIGFGVLKAFGPEHRQSPLDGERLG